VYWFMYLNKTFETYKTLEVFFQFQGWVDNMDLYGPDDQIYM